MRAFIAADLPAEARALLHKAAADIGVKASLVPEQNIHITMQFLGEISGRLLDAASEALMSIDERRFIAEAKGVGCFERGGLAAVVYASVEDNGELERIHSRLCSELSSRGVSIDLSKPYVPHITIARPRGLAAGGLSGFIKRHSAGFGSFTVSSISLKESRLTKEGPLYRTLSENKLL